MNTTLTLTLSSIKMFYRNKQALFFSLFTPLIIMIIFGFIGFDQVPKIDIGIATQNPSPATNGFITGLKNISAFNIHRGTLDAEIQSLNNGDLSLVVEIPDGYIPLGIPSNQTQYATAYVNAGQAQQAQTALFILNQILDKTTLRISGTPELFAIKTQNVNAHNLKYIDFLLPGIIEIAMMQMSVFSVAFVFADYREKGILKRLLATPMKPFQFVTANVVTRLITAIIQATILIAVGVLLFKAHVVGSYLLILLIAILGGIMFLGLGFTISGFAKTVESVPAIANLVVFPMLFLGGAFFPISSMPSWLQHFAKLLPLTYFSHALREVMTKDATLNAVHSDILAMSIWSVVLITFAVYMFRFSEKQA